MTSRLQDILAGLAGFDGSGGCSIESLAAWERRCGFTLPEMYCELSLIGAGLRFSDYVLVEVPQTIDLYVTETFGYWIQISGDGFGIDEDATGLRSWPKSEGHLIALRDEMTQNSGGLATEWAKYLVPFATTLTDSGWFAFDYSTSEAQPASEPRVVLYDGVEEWANPLWLGVITPLASNFENFMRSLGHDKPSNVEGASLLTDWNKHQDLMLGVTDPHERARYIHANGGR